MNLDNLKFIAFDADDTLWENETYFRNAETKFCSLLSDFASNEVLLKELFDTEISNLNLYGYGIKGFVLSMIETAHRISAGRLPSSIFNDIILIGKSMMHIDVKPFDGVMDTLKYCKSHFKLVLATKGDSVDQWRKLKKSGLELFFDHVEIMNEKKEEDYLALLTKLSIEPHQFMMIGNTLKSDVLPVLSIGAQAIHIPFHTTWIHEEMNSMSNHSFDSYPSMSDFFIDFKKNSSLF